MTALLLDTQIWLWYAEGVSECFSGAAVRRIDAARENEGLCISAISVWEVGMLAAKGKVHLSAPLLDWVERALSPRGVSLIPLDEKVAVESALLPGNLQADPADRLLISVARVQNLTLGTRDRAMVRYAKAGHARVLQL